MLVRYVATAIQRLAYIILFANVDILLSLSLEDVWDLPGPARIAPNYITNQYGQHWLSVLSRL